ncbi:sugar transferase [Haloplanus salinarum]|uniref:sugar transferase n=1 Tax=Haloplanus salinarum TaxID=1912324 RepID=UPI00214AE38D|nr:sugar transferase [Haloplanus salinarum]
MLSGWRYRLVSGVGATALAAGSVAAANHPIAQRLAVVVPVFDRLPSTTLSNGDLSLAIATTLFVVLGALVPLFKPRPRRVLDTILLVEKRVALAAVALAAVGYFDYTYRLPRTTLVLTTIGLGVVLPAWFVAVRRSPRVDPERTVVVGDDPESIDEVVRETDVPVVGYVAPSMLANPRRSAPVTDGGTASATDGGLTPDSKCLGGLSRLDEVLIRHDADAALLAFSHPDRGEFFGALDTCFAVGVPAMVHDQHADAVLTTGVERDEFVAIDLEPWDLQERLLKRAFDICFATVALLALAPLLLLIAAAIKLDSPGPVLYSQERTAEFGDTFTVYKFRSMIPDAESDTGAVLSAEDDGEVDPRVTRVGRLLRETHLDEVPQLWSILVGDMSVVGPRPERPELDDDIQQSVHTWQQRWFVRPGLTGLAQINDVASTEPSEKLRYDVAYIRNQSFWFDLRILLRQLWMVAEDAVGFLR